MPTSSLAPPSDIALTLALSLISASVAPVLLLDGNLTIVAASQSFLEAFNVGLEDIPGARLADLGGGEWNVPQLRSLLMATAFGQASINAYEMDLNAGTGSRRLILNVQRLVYDDADDIRLLMSIQDITEAQVQRRQTEDLIRQKDDLIRDKAILVQEVQHRTANSLQIIASVLMQGIRKVGSDESRTHLRDAHQRIMSVAAVQRQLAGSELGDVELRGYFTDLCRSIGDSMIRDHNQLALIVKVDDSIASSGKSVSLGLIVTELVINALKHAFPNDRDGRIDVDYRAHGDGWTLTVSDDGVGMPHDPKNAKPGLGTGIIQALATQLGAVIDITDSSPGVRVSIVCRPTAASKPAV
ncbi:sensor histidine kinase [Brevundimonas variabilis]|uniref:histidine kinase n=1 Tax=Brevundimonas variabilis TaxID=74312 RepID=A0A7W9CKV8_9CAUL|nr:histidine kinase dimerization/phosphoacceptor domain -containing protein [Brevundimonas variabilis]MBB5747563.1 two-component sensor histidine kinase [Brevundimonas variabilis]